MIDSHQFAFDLSSRTFSWNIVISPVKTAYFYFFCFHPLFLFTIFHMPTGNITFVYSFLLSSKHLQQTIYKNIYKFTFLMGSPLKLTIKIPENNMERLLFHVTGVWHFYRVCYKFVLTEFVAKSWLHDVEKQLD